MASQRTRPVGHHVAVHHARRRAGTARSTEGCSDGVVRDAAVALPPAEIAWRAMNNRASRTSQPGQAAMNALRSSCCGAGAVGVELQHRMVDEDRLGQAQRLLHHPGERDVGQAQLRLGIAAADVGMAAGEPHLLEAGAGRRRRTVLDLVLLPRHAAELACGSRRWRARGGRSARRSAGGCRRTPCGSGRGWRGPGSARTSRHRAPRERRAPSRRRSARNSTPARSGRAGRRRRRPPGRCWRTR